MTRDDDDDVDDTMAANPEAPRAFDRRVTTEPRRRKPQGEGVGRWEVVWREGETPDELTQRRERVSKVCRMCGQPDPAGVLHSHGDDIRRNVCAPCQGAANRGRV